MREKVIVFTAVLFLFILAGTFVCFHLMEKNTEEYRDGVFVEIQDTRRI